MKYLYAWNFNVCVNDFYENLRVVKNNLINLGGLRDLIRILDWRGSGSCFEKIYSIFYFFQNTIKMT